MPIFSGQRQKIESEWRQNCNFFTGGGGAFRQRDEKIPRSPRIRNVFARAACCSQILHRDKITILRPAGPRARPVRDIDFVTFFLVAKNGLFWSFFSLNTIIFLSLLWHLSKLDLFVVRIPPHSDFLGSVLRDITSPQVDKKYSFFDSTYETRSQFKGRLLRSEIFLRSGNIFFDSISYGALWKCQICRYFWYTHFWPPSISKEIVRVFDTFWSPTGGGTSGVSLRTSKLMVDFSGVAVFCHF